MTNGVIEKFAPLGRDPQTGGLGYHLTEQTSNTIYPDAVYDDDGNLISLGRGVTSTGRSQEFFLPPENDLPELPFELMGLGYGGVFLLAFQAKAPQNPPKQSLSSLTPEQQAWQNCAGRAWANYRKTYLKTSGKAILGGIGAGIGIGTMIGIRAAGIGLGIGGAKHAMADKGLPMVGRLLTANDELLRGGVIGGTTSFLSGMMAVQAVKEAGLNSDELKAALDFCAAQYPRADHAVSFLIF